MSDADFRELLSSPLDGPPAGGDRDGPRWPLFAVSLLGAAVITFGGLAAAGVFDGPTPATTVPPSVTTTGPPVSVTTIPAAAGPPLPAGYVPFGGATGIRPEWVLLRGDAAYVVLSTAVPAGRDPFDEPGFPGGEWELVLGDGRRLTFTREWRAAEAIGSVTVEFPAPGIVPEDLDGIAVRPAATRAGEVVEATLLPEDGLPWDGPPDPAAYDLDGVTLVIDSVALRPLAASVAWHLEGDDGARATVSAGVPGPDAEFPMFAPGHEFFAGFGQRRKAPPAPQRAGSAEMVITDSRTEVGSSPLTLRLSIEVLHYDTPEILLDLAGIPVDEV